MQIKEWAEKMSREGMVCTEYTRKIAMAYTKSEIFRILCDANGGFHIFDMHASGVKMPVDELVTEYAMLINGRKVVEYPQGYTSKFYCRYAGEIVADTTLVYVMESADVEVTVPKNRYPSVILSRGSSAMFAMEPGSRLNIELYGDASYTLSGDIRNVRVRRH